MRQVVAKYYRDDPEVDPSEPHQVWSTTKSWTSLLIGLLVDEGKLSVEETLGDIFPDEAAWAEVTDGTVDFRKDVSVHEMLTMTSGLIPPEVYSLETMSALPEDEYVAAVQAYLDDGGVSGGGTSLSHSLAYPAIGPKDEFHYLEGSQILSYVIKERSGMTPREYLAAKVMPALGIKEDEYNWLQNEDGVEFAFHGLEATATQMAKFGQLYLQGGLAKPPSGASETSRARSDEGQLVSKDWVEKSLAPYAKDPVFHSEYGYLWWVLAPGLYCTIGMYGQDTCIDFANGRVIAQQRDMNSADIMTGNLAVFTAIASDPTLSFSVQEQDVEEPEVKSAGTAAGMAHFSLFYAMSVLLLL